MVGELTDDLVASYLSRVAQLASADGRGRAQASAVYSDGVIFRESHAFLEAR